MSICQEAGRAWTKWRQYRKTKRIWTNWWSRNPEYAMATTSDKHVKRSKMIVNRYASTLDGCGGFCELGVGTGRNIHFFHQRFPEWRYRGNDIYPDIHDIITSMHPDLLEYAEITIADTLEYLKVCDDADMMFTYGHLMHLPDAVIEEVCALISSKANRFIVIYEAYPHKPGAKVKASYKNYRFERSYDNMFPGFVLRDKQVEEHPTKVGFRHCLYLFEKSAEQ